MLGFDGTHYHDFICHGLTMKLLQTLIFLANTYSTFVYREPQPHAFKTFKKGSCSLPTDVVKLPSSCCIRRPGNLTLFGSWMFANIRLTRWRSRDSHPKSVKLTRLDRYRRTTVQKRQTRTQAQRYLNQTTRSRRARPIQCRHIQTCKGQPVEGVLVL
jgi:hypothetical protein